MNFVDLKQPQDGGLCIPAGSILFVEDLSPEVKAESGAVTGIYYDLGAGPEAALLTTPFPRALKLAESASGEWLRLRRMRDGKEDRAAIPVRSIAGIRSLSEESGGGVGIAHRIGQTIYTLRANETFAEIRAMMAPDMAPPVVAEDQEEDDGERAGNENRKRRAGRGGGKGA